MKDLLNIHSIYDNNGDTFDRITVVLNEYHDRQKLFNVCLGISLDGVAFSQFSSCQIGSHLGNKVKWEELEEVTKKHIISRLS